MLHLTDRVEALEIRSPGDDPWGYLLPRRRTLQPGQVVETTVALDFGTSNTAIAWTPDEGKAEAVAMDQDAPPLELMAPSDPAEHQRMAQTLSLLPFWPKQKVERWYVPSELLYFKESDQWTIPHDAVEPVQFKSMEIRSDFKWKDQENFHRSIYLSFVLRMALANLRARGIKKVSLRATYPLAFESNQLTTYAKVLQQVTDNLAKETGMDVSLKGYINESISGMEACGQKTGNLQCVIDFGGGTTDIAVRIRDRVKGFTDPLFVDSIHLAGNDVLDSLLADSEILESLLQHGKTNISGEEDPKIRHKVARQTVLRELRNSGAGAPPPWWGYLVDHSSGPAQRFAVRNRAYFDGVLAYVLQLLAVAQEEMRKQGALGENEGAEIAVFLLGQGWGLLRLQVGKGDFEPRSYVERRLEELRTKLHAPANSKLQVIAPGYEVRNNPKLATSFGAAKLRDDQVRSAQDLQGKTGRDTIFGIDVEFYDGCCLNARNLLRSFTDEGRSAILNPVKKHDAWDRFVGPLLGAPGISDHVRLLFGPTDAERRTFVENRLTGLIEEHMGKQLAKTEILQTSPLLLLIEEVWAEQLKRVAAQVP
jgi:hypothetical protein